MLSLVTQSYCRTRGKIAENFCGCRIQLHGWLTEDFMKPRNTPNTRTEISTLKLPRNPRVSRWTVLNSPCMNRNVARACRCPVCEADGRFAPARAQALAGQARRLPQAGRSAVHGPNS